MGKKGYGFEQIIIALLVDEKSFCYQFPIPNFRGTL